MLGIREKIPKDVVRSSIFREEPCSWKHERVDELSSFAVLGLDVKITPDNEVKIIEVNGMHCGMKGFVKAQVSYSDFLYTVGKKGFFTSLFERGEDCETALEEHIKNLGPAQIAYVAAYLCLRDKHILGKLFGADIVLLNGTADEPKHQSLLHVHQAWHEKYGDFGRKLMLFEAYLDDKLVCDTFFDCCRAIKTPTSQYDAEGLETVLSGDNAEFFVIKERNGSCGYGMTVLSRKEVDKKPAFSSNHVVEAFVKSKEIIARFDRQPHDGCMRYVVFVEEQKDGAVVVNHFGGYWRLCPKPMRAVGDIDAMRANIAQGAIAQKASKYDIREVYSFVEQNIPIFYRRMALHCSSVLSWADNIEQLR